MTSTLIKKIIKASLWILLVACVAVFLRCNYYPKWQEISYKEQVQLSNGQRTYVDVTHYIQRNNGFDKYDGYYRDMEIAFDTGFSKGVFRKRFKNCSVSLVDRADEDYWYIMLATTSGISKNIEEYTPDDAIALRLDKEFNLEPVGWQKVPLAIKKENMVPLLTPTRSDTYQNHTFSVEEKFDLWSNNKLGPDDQSLTRTFKRKKIMKY